jgi:co-chaperonin GroES (HSP10)
MKAVGNNIIIKPLKVTSTEKTNGGLLLIEKDREDIRYQQASIVSVSDDIKGLKEKDEIYYDKRAGFGIEFNKEKFTVIKSQDVVVVL